MQLERQSANLPVSKGMQLSGKQTCLISGHTNLGQQLVSFSLPCFVDLLQVYTVKRTL